ncbi:hypothetical protein R3P38DRAFT_2779842 [Favolaschia claudopus]|uniref:Uncharacterized protein n=1 Tax=Favolaschia claudopus TaxID=2862362 RepID=A0AAW0BAF2_9AGAR
MTSETRGPDVAPLALEIAEILHQILQLAIEEATNQRFSETGQHPLNLHPERSSTTFPSTAGALYLQVNRQWRVCGCRPLYHTVILSRQAQIASLAHALRQNQNREPHLGGLIKVLVLYTGLEFGEQFEEIFHYANRIDRLSIPINIYEHIPDRDMNSLLHVLPSMNPRELILRDLPSETEGWVKALGAVQLMDVDEWDERKLFEKICACIRDDWKRLEVLRMAIPALPRNSARHSRIYDALPHANHLRDIHLRKSAVVPVLSGIIPFLFRAPLSAPMTVKYLTTLPHLKLITLQCQPCSLPPEYLDDALKFRIEFAPTNQCLVEEEGFKLVLSTE